MPTTATSTTRAFLQAFADHAGTTLEVSTVPAWLLKVIGAFSPLAKALSSMRYQWDIAYVPDDGEFRRTFGVEPTPLRAAVAVTLDAFTAPRRTLATA